jgi:type I restriction enzyme M protein
LLSHHILKIFEAYKQNQEIENFSKIIAQDEIKLKNYSLTIENYISDGIEYESIDIVKLNSQIKSSVRCQNEARNKIEELITDIEVEKNE